MAKINITPPTQTQTRKSKLGDNLLNSSSNLLSSLDDSPQQNDKSQVKSKDLNFKVSPEFHKEFKMFAFQNELTMAELLSELYLFYRNPNDTVRIEIAKQRNSNLAK